MHLNEYVFCDLKFTITGIGPNRLSFDKYSMHSQMTCLGEFWVIIMGQVFLFLHKTFVVCTH